LYVVFTTAYLGACLYMNFMVLWHGIFFGEYVCDDPQISIGNHDFREFMQEIVDDYNREIILGLSLFMIGLGLFFLFPLM